MRRHFAWPLVAFALLAGGGLAACQGCKAPNPTGESDAAAQKPTVRLYVVSTIAGALEPCGCTKDQLGGVDHLAAYVAGQKSAAPESLFVGAGPMLFMEPKLKGEAVTQQEWKAEALARAMKDLGVAAWAPGNNDWAGGADKLGKYQTDASAALLAGNVGAGNGPKLSGTFVREVGGVKIGVVGVADPKDKLGTYPDAVKATAPLEAMKAGIAEVKKQGARVLVGLAALPRGEALRLADALPELNVLVVGKPVEAGDANDAPKAPVLSGSTLIVETANHLQTVGVVDLFVKPGSADGPLTFADAGGVARAEEVLSVSSRIHDLEVRINSWEKGGGVKAEDLAARKADLEKLRADKAKLDADKPVVEGSFFRYTTLEVRDKLGSDPTVAARMLDFYKRVNEHNKVAFADRKPPAPEAGQAGYVGIETCATCHEDAKKFWDGTSHAHAYPTLEKQFKEFNLDCVSCHVTGYDKPGGSTVTFNAQLKNVQCETCHGPGSNHIKDPKKTTIVAKPTGDLCGSCHHPPHVEAFDPKEKMKLILGPGHGSPKG